MCPWNGISYSASIIFAAPAKAVSGIAHHDSGVDCRPWALRRAHVVEQIFGGRERRGGRLFPGRLELSGRVDGLLFAFADHRDVVALAHHFDESRQVPHGRFVDAGQLRARERRLHVARMNHARQLHVHGPFQRAVHFGGNVVALRRLAGIFELLHRSSTLATPVTALILFPVSVTLNFFPPISSP